MATPAQALLQPSRPTTAYSPPVPGLPSPGHEHPLSRTASNEPPTPAEEPAPFVVLPTFSKYQPVELRGTVKIRVSDPDVVFMCHREVLILASPVFEAMLTGDWAETSMIRRKAEENGEEPSSPVLSISKRSSFTTTRTSLRPSGAGEDDAVSVATQSVRSLVVSTPGSPTSYQTELEDDQEEHEEGVVAYIHLQEERAASFQALLCHIYPRLECVVNWETALELLALAAKFDLPSLHSACLAFLLPSAAGKPVVAMRIAEEHSLAELYKESSRFLLDNWAGWTAEELATLSESTLLKLERKRSWFLERLLKLGSVSISRDYSCHSLCPDSSHCARLLEEKWKSAWASAFRFNSPQPSIIYRLLRGLEPSLSSPALQLQYTACQSHARLFVVDLFDRMFGLSIQAAKPWIALGLASGGSASSYGRTYGLWTQDGAARNAAKYFLFVELDAKKERTQG